MSLEDTIYDFLLDSHPMDKRVTARRVVIAVRHAILDMLPRTDADRPKSAEELTSKP